MAARQARLAVTPQASDGAAPVNAASPTNASVHAATHTTTRAYIGLGANLGDAPATLQAALELLAATPGITALRASPLYLSAPVQASGADFHNAVAEVDTQLAPLPLLHALQAIEQRFGRQRPYRNAPRTLDLDLLLYAAVQQAHPVLTLPHPRLHERAFVLAPLVDLAPDLVLPSGARVADLLAAIHDQPLRQVVWPTA